MNIETKATVGIAGYHDPATRRGGWAIAIRLNGQDVELYGVLHRASSQECESYAINQAARALRRLRAPLHALEVTFGVKQALVESKGKANRYRIRGSQWAAAREWWKSVSREVGLRVTRTPADSYSAALRRAEIAAMTPAAKLRLTEQEMDTPANRIHRAERAEDRAQRHAVSERRKRQRLEDGANEYAEASGGSRRPSPYQLDPGSNTLDEMLAIMDAIEAGAKMSLPAVAGITAQRPAPVLVADDGSEDEAQILEWLLGIGSDNALSDRGSRGIRNEELGAALQCSLPSHAPEGLSRQSSSSDGMGRKQPFTPESFRSNDQFEEIEADTSTSDEHVAPIVST